jgi:hypothetical protein
LLIEITALKIAGNLKHGETKQPKNIFVARALEEKGMIDLDNQLSLCAQFGTEVEPGYNSNSLSQYLSSEFP